MYIPGLDSNMNDKTTGYGDLKLIDYKDVPSLMLQIIICKYVDVLFHLFTMFYFTFYNVLFSPFTMFVFTF